MVVFDPPPPGVLHAHRARLLIEAAKQVGLGHLQNIVYLDNGLRGDTLNPDLNRSGPGPWPQGWQRQVHRYLIVLTLRAGRDA